MDVLTHPENIVIIFVGQKSSTTLKLSLTPAAVEGIIGGQIKNDNGDYMKDYKEEFKAQSELHVEVFGPWLEKRGWSRFYNEQNWVKEGYTHHEFGVPADIAVMFELGLRKGLRAGGHTVGLME